MKRGFEENVPKVRPRVRLGRVLARQGRPGEARPELQRAAKEGGSARTRAWAHLFLGEVEVLLGTLQGGEHQVDGTGHQVGLTELLPGLEGIV